LLESITNGEPLSKVNNIHYINTPAFQWVSQEKNKG
jgi:hypothetical protein